MNSRAKFMIFRAKFVNSKALFMISRALFMNSRALFMISIAEIMHLRAKIQRISACLMGNSTPLSSSSRRMGLFSCGPGPLSPLGRKG